jgi:hypothetical protein
MRECSPCLRSYAVATTPLSAATRAASCHSGVSSMRVDPLAPGVPLRQLRLHPPVLAVELEELPLIDRYTKIVLQQPGAPFPLQRLAQLYRDRDGNVTKLVADFEKRASPPTRISTAPP